MKPKLTITKQTDYKVEVEYCYGPGNKKDKNDWIGLYRQDDDPAVKDCVTYEEVKSSSLDKGIVTFDIQADTSRDIVFYFIQNKGRNILAGPVGLLYKPELIVTRQVNNQVEVEYRNGPGNKEDWIGLYGQDDKPTRKDCLTFEKVKPLSPYKGTVTFSIKADFTRNLVFYFFENGGHKIMGGPVGLLHRLNWPKTTPTLNRACIIGHTTTSSCRIWIRTGEKGDFCLLYSLRTFNSDEDENVFSSFTTVEKFLKSGGKKLDFQIKDETNDTTIVLDITDLSSDHVYDYAVMNQNMSQKTKKIILGGEKRLFFRTIPEEKDSPFSFGFYSCHKPFKEVKEDDKVTVVEENMDVWESFSDTVKKEKLRFILAGGDQVYIDAKHLNMWERLRDDMREVEGELRPSEEEMRDMYREIYLHYWGFPSIQEICSRTPMYMTWDDHEILDGYGSYLLQGDNKDELDMILPNPKQGKPLSREKRLELYKRMVNAGKWVYKEYQHSYNPKTEEGVYDYSFVQGSSAFYVLDGRGYRDISKTSNKVLGQAQLDRFKGWMGEMEQKENIDFIFILSSIPVVHINPEVANLSETVILDGSTGEDDLRDCWASRLHNDERKNLLALLFEAVSHGKRVVILSGDVHMASAFKLTDKKNPNNVIYQLTSSGITYGMEPYLEWIVSAPACPGGDMENGLYQLERLGVWIARNYGVIHVNPANRNLLHFSIYQKKSKNAKNNTANNIEMVTLDLNFPKISPKDSVDVIIGETKR